MFVLGVKTHHSPSTSHPPPDRCPPSFGFSSACAGESRRSRWARAQTPCSCPESACHLHSYSITLSAFSHLGTFRSFTFRDASWISLRKSGGRDDCELLAGFTVFCVFGFTGVVSFSTGVIGEGGGRRA